jgi:type II secretory pathway component PulK
MISRRRRLSAKDNLGIALFILMTAIAIMSLMMRELVTASSTQAIRVKNSGDRVQALYLARSSLNLARFFLVVDRLIDSQKAKINLPVADRLDDIWATPNNFPLTGEEVQVLMKAADEKKSEAPQTSEHKDFVKKCEKFFDDFSGTAASVTTDLSGRLYLNDLTSANGLPTFESLVELLRPNMDFIQHLNELGVQPEALAREIRDYADQDTVSDFGASEEDPYISAHLDYKPKNRVFTNPDELKMIPHIDDYIFDYLSNFVSAYNIPASMKAPPSKINLNTVGKEVFQALLKSTVPNPQAVAEEFIKDRTEKKRTYTDKDLAQTLNDTLRLDNNTIRLNLLTGVSDSFKIETTATVNNMTLKLETIVVRSAGNKKVEPIVFMRVSP